MDANLPQKARFRNTTRTTAGWRLTALAFLAGAIVPSTVNAGDDSEPNLALAKAASLACESNFSTLKSFRCRYTITKAVAANPADAINGKYSSIRRCEFLLVVDGNKVKQESLSEIDMTPPKVLREGINPLTGQKGKYFNSDFVPVGELRNGNTAMSFTGARSAD